MTENERETVKIELKDRKSSDGKLQNKTHLLLLKSLIIIGRK